MKLYYSVFQTNIGCYTDFTVNLVLFLVVLLYSVLCQVRKTRKEFCLYIRTPESFNCITYAQQLVKRSNKLHEYFRNSSTEQQTHARRKCPDICKALHIQWPIDGHT